MKKIILWIIVFFTYINFIYANQVIDNSSVDNDYTLIDCVKWDNLAAIPLNSDNPYATLKVGIESTIEYINNNINKDWLEETSSWKVFNIKVECSFDDILNNEIELNFNWVDYNNELIIEWINGDSLVFKNIKFKLWNKAWNITFKNAKFLNQDNPYFYDFIFPSDSKSLHPYSNWVKIINSYIQLKNFNLWDNTKYKVYNSAYRNRWSAFRYDEYFNYSNKQLIEKSIIDIEIDNDFEFNLPVLIKNSKLNFINKTWSWVYDINFVEDWNIFNNNEVNTTTFISNEIDLWWNNIIVEKTNKIAFLNNKITNFSDFFMWDEVVYINNYIDNNLKIDISNNKNLFNNIFKSWFTDSYDINNYRKNYSKDNIYWKWLGWIYKRIRQNKYFNIDVNIASLYKEITWKKLTSWLWDIYIIFNY